MKQYRIKAFYSRPSEEPKMTKTLDSKLTTIRNGEYSSKNFIIADAKDGDMAMGMAAPGPAPAGSTKSFLSRGDYLEKMRVMTRSGLVDIMLMSASSAEVLVGEGLFNESSVTPAVRLNDTTDIWALRGNRYQCHPSRPFSTINLEKAHKLAGLGLYSVTFSNDLDHDYASTATYKTFREKAVPCGMNHFLEVFNPGPDIDTGLSAEDLPFFINDAIARILGGVTSEEHPLFLKIQYNGPKAMEELATYDPQNIIVGILGGSKGTTRDTLELVCQAERYGARVALFGRKINLADDSVSMVTMMRAVIEGELSPEEAVKYYHGVLSEKGIVPTIPVDEDILVTDPILK